MPNPLTNIANNKELLEAVREVFLKQFSIDGLRNLKRDVMTDELLGQVTRARLTGTEGVESAMKEIESHKVIPKSTTSENPAY